MSVYMCPKVDWHHIQGDPSFVPYAAWGTFQAPSDLDQDKRMVGDCRISTTYSMQQANILSGNYPSALAPTEPFNGRSGSPFISASPSALTTIGGARVIKPEEGCGTGERKI